MGPVLVSNELVGDPSALRLTTKVNGEVRQDESVQDLLFDCAYCIEYLSQGTTLQKGSVIMTGTPGGTFSISSPSEASADHTVILMQVSGMDSNPQSF